MFKMENQINAFAWKKYNKIDMAKKKKKSSRHTVTNVVDEIIFDNL